MKLSNGLFPAKVYHLLIVDDHPVTRHGLTQMIEVEQDLRVAASAAGASEALAHLRAAEFDLAIVDISLRGLSGIDLLKDLKTHWPKMPVLVFSMHDERSYAERALNGGARGYLMKQEGPKEVINAIRRVLDGCFSLNEAMYARILSKALQGGREPSILGSAADLLSNRELEVFRLLGGARGTREIAKEMHLSMKTVESYRAHIKKKLRLTSSPELLRAAIDWIRETEK